MWAKGRQGQQECYTGCSSHGQFLSSTRCQQTYAGLDNKAASLPSFLSLKVVDDLGPRSDLRRNHWLEEPDRQIVVLTRMQVVRSCARHVTSRELSPSL